MVARWRMILDVFLELVEGEVIAIGVFGRDLVGAHSRSGGRKVLITQSKAGWDGLYPLQLPSRLAPKLKGS